MDERTGMKFSDFFDTKNGMVEPTLERIHKWSQSGYNVKFVRLDNAGENRLLKTRSESNEWKMNLQFEFTARDTPQQNSLAEVGFAVIANRGRALMHGANIPLSKQFVVFHEAFKMATVLDGLMIVKVDGEEKTRYEHWCGKIPGFVKHLKVWGEAGTVKIKSIGTPKVADRGIHCMYCGPALNHPVDCHRMWDPKTDRLRETRDVIWLHRMFYAKPVNDKELIVNPIVEAPIDQMAIEILEPEDEDEDQAAVQVLGGNAAREGGGNVPPATASRELRQLQEPSEIYGAPMNLAARTRSENPREMSVAAQDRLTRAEAKYHAAMTELGNAELGCVGAGIGGGFENTQELHVMKYDQAMATEDCAKWVKAIDEEHEQMLKHKVWTPVPRSEVPEGATILTTTWAMKKKSNGTFRARLNARGFEQQDGEHFDKDTIASPVVNEATIKIMLILLAMHVTWVAMLMDVRGAFLHGLFDPGHILFMEIPQGFEKWYPSNVVLLLLKTIYGLRQAAYAFWKIILEAFRAEV